MMSKKIKWLFIIVVFLMLTGCTSKETDGKFIDIRERSEVLDETELSDGHLPKDIVKNKNGATKGTPIVFGDTVIYRDFLGEELGLSIVSVERGEKAQQKIKEKLEQIEEAPEGMEYLLLEIRFDSYDSKEEPYPIFTNTFELWTDDKDSKKYTVKYHVPLDNTKEYLKTGENTKDSVAYLVPKNENNLYAVYTYVPDDLLWFSLK